MTSRSKSKTKAARARKTIKKKTPAPGSNHVTTSGARKRTKTIRLAKRDLKAATDDHLGRRLGIRFVTKTLATAHVRAYVQSLVASRKRRRAYTKLNGRTLTATEKSLRSREVATSRLLSEAMGEAGAQAYIGRRTKNTAIAIAHASARTPFAEATRAGTAWPGAVAFHGSGVADVTYWDGEKLYVVEAKGGGSKLKKNGREQLYNPETGVMQPKPDRKPLDQGSLAYLVDIAWAMHHSAEKDGRHLVGTAILGAVKERVLEYVPVSTTLNVMKNLHTLDDKALDAFAKNATATSMVIKI